ncbi:hypothetical protein Ancab_012978 [Ancistrocladus abbreviatus]
MAGLVQSLLQIMLGQTPLTTFAPPPSPIVVIGPQFVAPYPVYLVINQNLMTIRKREFIISDVYGNVYFTIKDYFLAIPHRRVLLDAAGNPLVTLRRKLVTAHRRWQVFRGDSSNTKDLLFSAKKSSLIQFFTKLDVFLAGNTQESAPDFRVKGSFLDLGCTIYLGSTNTDIAQMHRHYKLPTIAVNQDSYGVTVNANVDYAFIVALIVVLHEINKDQRGDG